MSVGPLYRREQDLIDVAKPITLADAGKSSTIAPDGAGGIRFEQVKHATPGEVAASISGALALLPSSPVLSVNGGTGVVVLTAAGIGADVAGTAAAAVAAEATNRTNADNILSGFIATKANATDLTAEITARSTADSSLQGQIDGNASATTTALALKANRASPAFTGIPTAPTPAQTDNSTQLATTAMVQAVMQAIVGMTSADLDTLQEIAARIVSGESTVAALAASDATKLAKASNLSDLTNVATAQTNLNVFSQTYITTNFLSKTATGAQTLASALSLPSISVTSATATAVKVGGGSGFSLVAQYGAAFDQTGRFVVNGEFATGNGAFNDPAPGVGYDAKYGGSGGGIAVRGASLFLSGITASGNLTLAGTGSLTVAGAGTFGGTTKVRVGGVDKWVADNAGNTTQAGTTTTTSIILTPRTTPTTPTSGSILYCDSADGKTKIIGTSGTPTIIANA